MYRREIAKSNKGSTLAAALALVFLVLALTTISLTRVACTWSQVSLRHRQTTALFLAEAGIKKAGQMLIANKNYAGETGTALPTGTFDTKVSRSGTEYIVTSTGLTKSAFKIGRKRTVQARIRVSGSLFSISDWRENP